MPPACDLSLSSIKYCSVLFFSGSKNIDSTGITNIDNIVFGGGSHLDEKFSSLYSL